MEGSTGGPRASCYPIQLFWHFLNPCLIHLSPPAGLPLIFFNWPSLLWNYMVSYVQTDLLCDEIILLAIAGNSWVFKIKCKNHWSLSLWDHCPKNVHSVWRVRKSAEQKRKNKRQKKDSIYIATFCCFNDTTFLWNSWCFGPTRCLRVPHWSKASFISAKSSHS